MSNLDLRIAEIMLGDTQVLKIMKGNIKKWPLSTYTVTTNLINITSDAPATIIENSPLTINLTVNSGHYMDDSSVVVMMGNTDISSTYSNGIITIPSVTGNISIAARTMFDAQVEYLESDGTAYIDTGVKVASTVRFIMDMYIDAEAEKYIGLFGGRTASLENAVSVAIIPDIKWRWYYGTGSGAISVTNSARHVFDNNTNGARRIYVDGSLLNAISAQTFSTDVDFYIFGINNNGSPIFLSGSKKLYSGKLYTGTTLVRNYIPVRKDNVGYLFDIKSKTLYGNANSSGSFTYGSDVVN